VGSPLLPEYGSGESPMEVQSGMRQRDKKSRAMFRSSSIALQHNLATHLELQGVDITQITRLGAPKQPADPNDQPVSLARILAVMVRACGICLFFVFRWWIGITVLVKHGAHVPRVRARERAKP
jgi:hypothetical protein